MPFADTPSLGALIGLPIALLILLASMAVFVMARRSQRAATDSYGRDDAAMFKWGAAGVAVITVIATGFAMWPWQADYHMWRDVSGRVERISSRFLAQDKGTSQRYVVVINGQPYGVDDTRASLLKVGDHVSLSCKREYQWGSSNNGWGCRWNGSSS